MSPSWRLYWRWPLSCPAQLPAQWGRRWLLVLDTAILYVNMETGHQKCKIFSEVRYLYIV